MHRDLDLVRDILLLLDSGAAEIDAATFVSDRYSYEYVSDHYKMMEEAGLIDAIISRDMNGTVLSACATNITWEGNDYLAAVKNENIWADTKKKLALIGATAALETVKAVAVKIATDYLLNS